MTNTFHAQIDAVPAYVSRAWPILLDQAERVAAVLSSSRTIFLCGCGDSHHAARGLEMVFSEWVHRTARAAPSMEVGRYLLPAHSGSGNDAAVVAISSSGEVARTIEAVEIANRLGFAVVAFTNSPESTLAKLAQHALIPPLEPLPVTPGLLGYIGSLLAGWSIAYHHLQGSLRTEVAALFDRAPDLLADWIQQEKVKSSELQDRIPEFPPMIFLGSGPAYGSSMFAAAKCIEATGRLAWAQDVEEWCHLEYFCNPANLPVWMLSAKGRSDSREKEVLAAARAIEREVVLSQWESGMDLDSTVAETLAPLFLWAGPSWFAADMMDTLGASPFRGFGGGRSAQEGGGPSRIRSSERVDDLRFESP